MSTNNRNKRNVTKGRRWIFSKKKMKEPEDDGVPHIFDLKRLLELREIQLKPRMNVVKSSKLIPKLQDILKKSTALGYFLDFLKERNKKYLLDFWLEAETFRMVSRSTSSSSHENSVITSYSTRSSPCIQRYRQPTKHLRTVSVSSMSSNLVSSMSRHSFSKHCDETPTENNENNISQEETSENINKCLFKSSSEELNITNDNSLDQSMNSACFCAEVNNTQFNTKLKNETGTLINFDKDNYNKTDEINLMHPSNHEWGDMQELNDISANTSNHVNDKNVVNDSVIVDDSLEKGFERLFMQKSGSTTTVSSMEELRQRSRGRSLIVDANTIYNKYICGTGDSPIDLPVEARQQIEGFIGNKDRNILDPNIFVRAQDYVLIELTSLHEKFLHTANMINYQIKLLEEKKLTFADVMYNDHILFYFMEFLDQIHSKSTLEFYITVQNFEEDIEAKLLNGEYNAETAVNDAMYIYERYFSMKCEHQLIEDDKLRIVLENNICRSDGPQPNCFCIPLAYAWTVLNDIHMPLFLKSDIYVSYIEHLTKILAPPDEVHCTSARSSISLEDHSSMYEFQSSKLNLLEDNNLEEFWFKEPGEASSGLSLGRVNEYGIFNSVMEPEPQRDKSGESSVSKFGKAMKNFLRRETPEETEQLAWRRAEKIIADIQKETTLESRSSNT